MELASSPRNLFLEKTSQMRDSRGIDAFLTKSQVYPVPTRRRVMVPSNESRVTTETR